MKTLVLGLAIAALLAVATGSNDYDFKLFHDEIDAKCLARWFTNRNSYNDMHPLGFSLEGFISIVEKVEEKHTDWDIYRLSKELLRRFAFEEIEYSEISGERKASRKSDYQMRWNVLSKLIPNNEHHETRFREDDLTDEEKCTMFFMMGHLVNDTFRETIDDDSLLSDVPLDGPGKVMRTAKTTKRPREQGVVSVRGHPQQAIAISKVLNAIVTAQSRAEPTINDINQNLAKHNDGELRERKIRPDIGVTLGDVLSSASVDAKVDSGTVFFGPGGDWNATSCPSEFTLRKVTKHTASTNAVLRGAVDGLLISHALKTWNGGSSGIRLSRVLRMYYSPVGFPLAQGLDTTVSYCRRQDVTTNIGQTYIQESVLTHYYLYIYERFGQVFGNSQEKVNNAIDRMRQALVEFDGGVLSTEECVKQGNRLPDNPVCETPSNVFVVLDSSERLSDGYKEQENIVGLLASNGQFGLGAGSLSVFQDKRQGDELTAISYNDTNPTCAACKAVWLDQSQLSGREENEVYLLNALNATLKRFEKVIDLEPGVPSRTAILFLYRQFTETNKQRLREAARTLQEGHRDTNLLLVGSDRNQLLLISRRTEDVFTEGNDKSLADTLKERICQAPAIFQFNRCWDHKRTTRKEDENRYVGYVTPKHVQFWAFHPEYYLKSYNIKVTFHVDDGDITVCHGRNNANPGFTSGSNQVLQKNKDNCRTTSSNERDLVFKFDNPCDGYNVHDCPTMNFAIIGETKAQVTSIGCDGSDHKCRRLDQIKFQVQHEGIACSGCELLKSTPAIFLAAALFFYFKGQ